MTTIPRVSQSNWLLEQRAKRYAELRAAQAEPVRKVLDDILESLTSLNHNIHWALDSEQPHEADYCLTTVLERAHQLVDLAHDYRAALKATP